MREYKYKNNNINYDNNYDSFANRGNSRLPGCPAGEFRQEF